MKELGTVGGGVYQEFRLQHQPFPRVYFSFNKTYAAQVCDWSVLNLFYE